MIRSYIVIMCAFLFAFAAEGVSAQTHKVDKGVKASMAVTALETPSSIREEHQHLHHELDLAITSGGRTGARARAVADVLVPHFKAEEAYAMPPLGLLVAIAHDQTVSAEQAHRAIGLADQLRAHYDQMILEHQQIHTALEALAAAAREEHKPEVLTFAEALMLHAQNEEQVLYPATLLVGKYLTLRQTLEPHGKPDHVAAPTKP